MSTTLTVNASTLAWTLTSTGIIAYADGVPHTGSIAAGGPWACIPVQVPFDPIHQTGGSFYELTSGPNTGKLISAWTNSLGYGDMTVTTGPGEYEPPVAPSYATVDPLADWRILIKAMGGESDAKKTSITIVDETNRYSRGTNGKISPTYPRLKIQPGGPYTVEPLVVPYDDIWHTGGSFWRMTSGPYIGWLISKWTNTLFDEYAGHDPTPYGRITVSTKADFDRGPGEVLATLYAPNAHLAGFSTNYNAPGELHFTLLVDDPNILVPLPKRTHATVEFYNKSTSEWDEVWAGMIWDMDATETEVVFYGIDYLGLLQYCVDERYDPNKPLKPPPTGSYYLKKSIKYIIDNQLDYARGLDDSPVEWITVSSTFLEANFPTKVTIYSTLQQTLPFVVGLLDSHRSGSGKQSRISVKKIAGTDGDYEFVIEDNPGAQRDSLELRYGSMVQGYRAIPFGTEWASRVNLVGRRRDGLKVEYRSDSSGIDQGEYGRIAQGAAIIETEDTNDLKRRAKQAALDAARLGRQISVGLKLGSFRPFEGYDLCDSIPIDINHGGVATKDWASDVFADQQEESGLDPSHVDANYWTIKGLTWESYDDGHWMTNLSLFPRGGGIPVVPHAEPPVGTYNPNPTPTDEIVLPETPVAGSLMVAIVTAASDATYNVSGWTLCGTPLGVPEYPTEVEHDSWVSMYWRVAEADEPTTVTFDMAILHGVFVWRIQANGTATAGLYYTHSDSFPPTSTGHYVDVQSSNVGDYAVYVTAATFSGNASASTVSTGDATELLDTGPDGNSCWAGYVIVPVTDADVMRLEATQAVPAPYAQIAMEFLLSAPLLDSDPIVTPLPMSSGWGVPVYGTTTSDTYVDLYTGITYVRNDDTETYDPVVGTGSIVDFTFTSSATWVITHTVGGYPRVTLQDSGGTVIDAQIVYDSTTQITVTFSSAVAGMAHLG